MPGPEILPELARVAGAFEAYHVSTYQMYRRTKDGRDVEVTIRILDAGPGSPARYHVHAKSADGKTATGNPDSNLVVALSIVHWYKLD